MILIFFLENGAQYLDTNQCVVGTAFRDEFVI